MTPVNFSVRAARPADHKALAGLLAELLGEPELAGDLEGALNTNLLRLLSQPGTALLVAEEETGRGLLGFASLWTRWGLFDDAPGGLIDRLVVRRGWEGSAVPHALLEQALGACGALGCGEVTFLPTEDSLVPEGALLAVGFSLTDRKSYFVSIL